MFSKLTVTHKGLILVFLPVAFEIISIVFLGYTLAWAEKDFQRLEYERETLLGLQRFTNAFADCLLSLRLLNPNDRESSLKAVVTVNAKFVDSLKGINDRQELQEAQAIHNRIITEGKKLLDDPIPASRRAGCRSLMIRSAMELDNLTRRVVDRETTVKALEASEMTSIRERIFGALLAIVVSSILLTIALVRFFTHDLLIRLKQIENNAQKVASGSDLPPVQSGSDEIAQLDADVHHMQQVLFDTRKQELAILDNAVNVICSLDSKFRFVAANNAASTAWKYDASELLGFSLTSLLQESTRDSTIESLRKIADHEGEGSVETVMRCGDGTKQNSLWSVNFSAKDNTYFCVIHDVTERRAIEKLKHHFLSIVSHDLRSPMNAIGVSLAMLQSGKRGELSNNIQNELIRVESTSRRLMNLIDDLLELDKLESTGLSIERKTVHAYNVCAAAKETLAGMATASGVTLQGPKGDALIVGDEKRLVQATCNLISNAIKFSPKDSTVTLSVNRLDDSVEIRISDRGPGIAPADRAIIFDKFRQSASVSNVAMKSSGLGLAIVKNIVVAHGGEVGVDSELGEGSSFWLRIPGTGEIDRGEGL